MNIEYVQCSFFLTIKMSNSTTIVNVTANTTMSSLYDVYLVNASASNITLTLPLITCNGTNYNINRYDFTLNTLTLSATGSNFITINSGVTATSVSLNGLNTVESYNNSWYLLTGSGPTGPTGPTTQGIFPPVPNNDYYSGRTNEIININVINGVTGNTGGAATLGGALTNPTNAINSVTIVTSPLYGTLTASGTTGLYTYRSNPRFVGQDQFMYKITDSTGVVSKNTATCIIDVLSLAPSGTGLNCVYGTTDSNNIIQYTSGTTGLLFTATFPGFTGTAPTGTNNLATNRDDNLIYYTANNGGTASNFGKIYAYDYVNSQQFLLTNANSGTIFPTPGAINFSSGGATYFGQMLYMGASGGIGSPTGGASSTGGYYQINVGAYNPTTISQTITAVAFITDKLAVSYGDLAWNHVDDTIVIAGTGTINPQLVTLDPYSGFVYNNVSMTGGTGLVGDLSITCSNNNIIYLADSAGVITTCNLSNGSVTGTNFSPIPTANLSDLGEWPNQPT